MAGCRFSTCSAAIHASRRSRSSSRTFTNRTMSSVTCFPLPAIGESKAVLAEHWLQERRPESARRAVLLRSARPWLNRTRSRRRRTARLGVCAADNELGQVSLGRPHAPLTQTVDARRSSQRRHRRLRSLVRPRRSLLRLCRQLFATHRPGGQSADRPIIRNPAVPVTETTIPASKASIHAIASLHASARRSDLLKQPDRLSRRASPACC